MSSPAEWIVVAVLKPATSVTMTQLREALQPGSFEVQTRATQGFLVREQVTAESPAEARDTFVIDLRARPIADDMEIVSLSVRPRDDS